MKVKIASIIFFVFCFSFSNAQEIWYPESFIRTQSRLNKDGSLVLNSWALANIGFGSYQLTNVTGENLAFGKMNLIWGGLELARGIPTMIRSYRIYKEKIPLQLDKYKPKKNLFLYSLNSWLDLAYIGTGIILYSRANQANDPDAVRGFGKSFMLQGGFLFTFDSVMYLLHRKLMKNHIRNQKTN